MTFFWPFSLLSLLLVPVLAALYVFWLRRRRKYAVHFSDLSLIRQAVGRRPTWRRHIPFAILLLALASLAIGSARPHVVQTVNFDRTSIILAIDVSRSMCADDVEPNRLTVAQDAARTFVQDQRSGTRIGLVAFSGNAQIVVPPTDDAAQLVAAIDRFTTSFGTAIGSAQLKAIDAISEVNDAVAPSDEELSAGSDGAVDDGDFQPDAVVLLTDGANSSGTDPLFAAEQAAHRGVRVYTIGFGTTNPTQMACGETQVGAQGVGGDSFGTELTGQFDLDTAGFEGGNTARLLVIDEPTLQSIAALTGGQYFRAENSGELVEVFSQLPTEIGSQQQDEEVSWWFTAAGLIAVLAAVVLSLRSNRT